MEAEKIEFHIVSHDYFGTLATILDLLRQKMKATGYSEKDAQLLERLTDELLYLQANHIIQRAVRKQELDPIPQFKATAKLAPFLESRPQSSA